MPKYRKKVRVVDPDLSIDDCVTEVSEHMKRLAESAAQKMDLSDHVDVNGWAKRIADDVSDATD